MYAQILFPYTLFGHFWSQIGHKLIFVEKNNIRKSLQNKAEE